MERSLGRLFALRYVMPWLMAEMENRRGILNSDNKKNETLETVAELEKAAEQLKDITAKLEDLAAKAENKAEEVAASERLLKKVLAKKTFGIIGWGFCAFVAASIVAQEIALIIMRLIKGSGGDIPGIVTYLVSFLPMYAVAFPILLLIIRKLPKDNAEKKSIDIFTLIKCFCMCITIMYIGNVIGTGLSSVIGNIFDKTSNNNLAELIMNTEMLSTFVFVVIFGPIMEEIVFRKILIDRTVKFGERNAMFLSAFMFALFHMNLFQFFYAFGIGLIFAYIYIKSRRIEYSIAFHMIINFMGSVVAVQIAQNFSENVVSKLQSGNPELVSAAMTPGVIFSLIYSFAIIILFFVGLALIIAGRKKVKLDVNGAPFNRKEEKGLVYGNYGMAFFIAVCIVMMVLTTVAQME